MPSTSIFFRLYPDYLGSIEWVTNADGRPVEYFCYSPWGETLHEDDSWRGRFRSPFKFTGRVEDEETGLTYAGARYYPARVGKWLSVDPLAHKYPTLTPYAYVANNPVNMVDPDGMRIKPAGKQERAFLKKWASINFGDNSGIKVGRNSVKINNKKFGAALEQMDPGTRQLAESFRDVVEDKRTAHFKLGDEITVTNHQNTGRYTEEQMGERTIQVPEVASREDKLASDFGGTLFIGDKDYSLDNHGILINPSNHFEENGVLENKYSTFSHEIGHLDLFFKGVDKGDSRHHSIPILFENITRFNLGEDMRSGIFHEH